MNKIFITLAIILSIVPSVADEPTKFQTTTAEHLKLCGSWGRFAELAMQAHQRGVPMTDQMALSPDPRAYELTLEAYQSERFQTQRQQEIAATTYRDKTSAECLMALADNDRTDLPRPAQFWAIH